MSLPPGKFIGFMCLMLIAPHATGAEPTLIAKPDAFTTLVNPACSHCKDEAKRRASELQALDRVMCWTRGYSEGGAIPIRFFLAPYRVISDSYGVFVYDPDAGFARGFEPSFEYRFHGWRNGVMVMKHNDGTLYSCLSGLAFAGPNQGARLKPIPTLMSDWGQWLERYPNAVAYHMLDKYRPIDLPTKADPDSTRSRSTPDPRLPAEESLLGIWTGKSARAFPLTQIERGGLIHDEIDGQSIVIFWEPKTRTTSAYRPIASAPRKFRAPRPNAKGISPVDAGTPIPAGAQNVAPRKLTLKRVANHVQDAETNSVWDVAGRCISGELTGWTLEWVDSVQVKWIAWAAEFPATTIGATNKQAASDPKKPSKVLAGQSEFLRILPKPYATLEAVDPQARTVKLLIDGESTAKEWPVEPDAEIKVAGWWGRLGQFKPGDRVWAWLKLDRKKNPTAVIMLADELSECYIHAGEPTSDQTPKWTDDDVNAQRDKQKAWLRQRWLEDGLPGTLTFQHVFTGELEVNLDHEAQRWARSLAVGAVVHLSAEPPIKAVVKSVTPWRERTTLRLVVGELESSELKIGQRLGLRMASPSAAVESSVYPPDMDRPRPKAERIEWFLASMYCTCGIAKDTCTGHYYTLASCNPNTCGQPNRRRQELSEMIERGLSDQAIFDELLKTNGPLLLRPHLKR